MKENYSKLTLTWCSVTQDKKIPRKFSRVKNFFFQDPAPQILSRPKPNDIK